MHFRRSRFLPLVVLILSATAQADTAKFTLHKVEDSNGSHHTAITYLLPVGWKTNDTIVWDIGRANSPMISVLNAFSPDGHFWFSYTNTAGFWYVGMGKNRPVKGTPPPEKPADFIVDTIKKENGGVDIEILDSQETPATSTYKTSPGSTIMRSHAATASVKLRFLKNGVPTIVKAGMDFDECDSGTPFGRNNGFVSGFWFFKNFTVIAGPEAQFPKAMKLAGVALSSQRMDPQFFQQYLEVYQKIVSRQLERGKAQFDEMRREYHALSAANKEAFQAQMAARDKNSQRYCDYLLDQTRYTDGHTDFIMPSGYSYAAKNANGEYIVTNDPTFNKYKDWQELQKAY